MAPETGFSIRGMVRKLGQGVVNLNHLNLCVNRYPKFVGRRRTNKFR